MLNFPLNSRYGYSKSPSMMGWIEHERTLSNPNAGGFQPAVQPKIMGWIEHERTLTNPGSGYFQPAVQPKSPEIMGWIEHERTLSNPGNSFGPVDIFQPSSESASQPMYFDCMIREPRQGATGGAGSIFNFIA